MQLVVVAQWVQVPPDSRRANRSGAHPRASPSGAVRSRVERGCRPCDGAPPCVEWWTQGYPSRGYGGESRRYPVAGRQPSWARYGEGPGHHRGLRAGHGARGGRRERGRATGLLDHSPGLGDRATTGPGVTGGFLLVPSPSGETTNSGSRQGIGATRDQRSPPRRTEGGRRGAEYRGRWGSEAQATHGRAGAVGQSSRGQAPGERPRAHQPCPQHARGVHEGSSRSA